jgi:sulfide:quinone oxidoreductase
MDCDLTMLIPPFSGPGSLLGRGITESDGYVRVENTMRVPGVERTYAVGDCVDFEGPKLGHMAVRQGEVAAQDLTSEIEGSVPTATYDHEMMSVIEADGADSIFLHKHLWTDDPATIKQGIFWKWAKLVQEKYWKRRMREASFSS